MTASVCAKPVVVNPTIPTSLARRRASDDDQAHWTDEQRAVNSCMHCKTPYKEGSGAASVCEHWHEGL